MAPDAQVSTVVMCKYDDPALRLCVEFADGNYSTATEGSQYHFPTNTSDLIAVMRSGQRAAGTWYYSRLSVDEHQMLDITPMITFETWMSVPDWPGYNNAALVSNQNQYGITIDDNGRVACQVGSLSARTDNAIGKETWRHVACVFDGAQLVLYVDGAVTKCQPGSIGIPTAGTNGTRLISGFAGGIDDMRIYARNLSAAEICSHADKTACASTCP